MASAPRDAREEAPDARVQTEAPSMHRPRGSCSSGGELVGSSDGGSDSLSAAQRDAPAGEGAHAALDGGGPARFIWGRGCREGETNMKHKAKKEDG